MDSIINYLDKYSDLIVEFQLGFLVIILSVFLWVWYYNRRKYNHLKHQIPASVVKSYLDSIIQNSTSLKSSLFRGNGLDIDSTSIPSVMPLDNLVGGASVNINTGSNDDSALRAQIAGLQAQLSEKNNIISELETKSISLEGLIKQKQERIDELEKLLAEARSNTGSGVSDSQEVDALKKERDDLKEELQQYDIISNDIADMKRLKQENEQLKKALADAGASSGSDEFTAEENPVGDQVADNEEEVEEEVAMEEVAPVLDVEDAPEEEVEEVLAESSTESDSEENEDSDDDTQSPDPIEATANTSEDEDDKSPEDLLSEFEKMLG